MVDVCAGMYAGSPELVRSVRRIISGTPPRLNVCNHARRTPRERPWQEAHTGHSLPRRWRRVDQPLRNSLRSARAICHILVTLMHGLTYIRHCDSSPPPSVELVLVAPPALHEKRQHSFLVRFHVRSGCVTDGEGLSPPHPRTRVSTHGVKTEAHGTTPAVGTSAL